MPTIKRYSSNVNVANGGTINVRRASGEDFGAAAARDLGQLGGAITKFGAQMEDRKNKRDAVAVQRALIEADTQFQTEYAQAKLDAPFGAEGFGQQTTDRLNVLQTDLYGRFNDAGLSEANALKLDSGLMGMRRRAMIDSVSFESVSTANKLKFDIEESFEQVQNKVLLDPSRYDEQLEQGKELVAAARTAGLPAEAATKLEADFVEKLTANKFDGLLARVEEPEQIVALRAEVEASAENMNPRTTAAMLRKVQQAEQTIKKKKEIEARRAVRAYNAAAIRGEATAAQEIAAQEGVNLIGDPVARQKMLRGLTVSKNINQTTALIRGASKEELVSLEREMAAKAGNSRDDANGYERLVDAIERREKALEKDPATYALKGSPRVQRAYNKYIQSPQSPEAFDAYARASQEEQERMGVAPNGVKFLTSEMVAQFKANISDDNTADDASDAQFLRTMKDFYGSYWGEVSNQLVKEKAITGHDITIANMNEPGQVTAATKLKTAASVPEKEWKNMLGEVKPKDVDDAVVAAFGPLARTLPANGAGSDLMSQYVESAKKLARSFVVNNGMSAEAAAQQAYEEIKGRTEVSSHNGGGYRIPRNVVPDDIDEAHISSRLKGMTLSGEIFDNIVINGVPNGMTREDALKQMKLRLHKEVHFKNYGSGLVAIDTRTGDALINRDGSPVTATWTEIVSHRPEETVYQERIEAAKRQDLKNVTGTQ